MNQITSAAIHTENKQINFGFFENQFKTAESIGGMNNNGWRRFRRNGIVPQAILTALRQSGIIKQDAWIFEGGTTVGELLDFLKCYPYESEQTRVAGDYLFEQVFKGSIPFLSKTFVQGGQA